MGSATSLECCVARDRKDEPHSHDSTTGIKKAKIRTFYNISEEQVGKGAFAFVAMATERTSGAKRAIKCCNKAQSKPAILEREMKIMGSLHHPHIVRLYESYEDHVYIYLVLEPCLGGELFAKILELKRLTEKDCATLMHQLLYAINYMHKSSVCHRDLKPENLLLRESVTDISNAELKVTDLGFAHRVEAGTQLKSRCGSPLYVAPEVMSGAYDERCDLWSCGVILFVLLSGEVPFHGKCVKDTLRMVCRGEFSFKSRCWEKISDECKEFVKTLLKLNVGKRATAEQALANRWIAHKAPESHDNHIHEDLIGNMRAFHQENRMQKVAMHIMAKQMDQSAIEELRDVFVSMDTNKDGHLSIEEFREGIKTAKIDFNDDLTKLMEDIDTDKSGDVDYTEFLAATLDRRIQAQENTLWAAFCTFDVNKDGVISQEEFQQVLEREDIHENCSEIKAQLREMGFKKDAIDFKDFMQLIRGSYECSPSFARKSMDEHMELPTPGPTPRT